MKYGLNQWARVSSLLVRKSPKQCKQRWYEWLDPKIRKTAWTREEEEKLLHLAKIMPTQWRTIAGVLEGRTPTQCLQRYEELLDQAQGKDGLEDDPRRLRPGEIDPNPEVKPALPDPVDFDEDEKEMLQEARARLANTKGKKAKRKAREKTLDDAKRLASLQKRRELKANGIHMPVPPTAGSKKKRTKMIDVMAEIPFHHEAPAGFHDTSKEDQREAALSKNPRFRSITLQKLEGERMADVTERARKKDNESMKKLKQDNLPAAMAKISKLNDVQHVAERPALVLPEAQITNSELDAIAKATLRGGGGGGELEEDDEGVTGLLMPRVEQTPSFTPMRTPMAAPGTNTVLREAQFLAASTREAQTPLVGGNGPAIADFVAPSNKPLVTPNMLKTPTLVARTGRTVAATPLRSPATEKTRPRSQDDDGDGEEEEEGGSKRRKTVDLLAGLAALPEPKNEFRLAAQLPKTSSSSSSSLSSSSVPVDAADVRSKFREKVARQERAVEQAQSEVVRRNFPRALDASKASRLRGSLGAEVARLIEYDNAAAPLGKKKRVRVEQTDLPPMEHFSEQELQAARDEIAKDEQEKDKETRDEFDREWESVSVSLVYVAGRGLVRKSELSPAELAAALKAEYSRVVQESQALAAQCQKLEAKLHEQHQG